MFSKYEDLIIRPPRTVPLPSDLGPVKTAHFEREEFRLVNARGQALFGTLIRPTNSKTSDGNNDNTNRSCPVLVYAHANASNRARALEWRSLLVEELGAVLVAFDFAGCGESEGQYISLGVHEAQDLACVLDFVEEQLKGSPIVLCGRSMGSAAVMMYAAQHIQKHPFVVGLIFDGVFESLRSLMTDLAKQSSVLGLLAPLGVPLLRRRIQQKADFDIDELDLVEKARMVGIPALFFVAKADELFPRKHMDHVFSAYKGSDKTLVDIEGGHNDFRGDDFWRAACSFLCRLWNLPPIPIADGMQVAQVLPFVLQGEELEPARDEFVPGPLSVDVQRDCIKFFPLFRKADTEPVWTFRYTSFVGMDSGPALFRIMFSETAGVLVQTPKANELMAKVDKAINSYLREELLADMDAFLERIRRAACLMLETNDAKEVKQKIQDVMLKDLGLQDDKSIEAAVSKVIEEEVKKKQK